MSDINKGKRYESRDGEKGGIFGVEIEEAMKCWRERDGEREARFMASGRN